MSARLILASASPRRRELLTAAGLAFEVEPSEVDEEVEEGQSAEETAVRLATSKALAVASRYPGQECLVLGADTVVALDTDHGARLLGKPRDAGQAREMLESLSNTRHRVVTGVAVVRASDGAVYADFERTWVHMRPIRAPEVEAYVASEEWRDKAGGYAIQENADAFVTRLEEGGFDNVVGLPVHLTRTLLEAAAGRLSLPPDVG